MSTEEHIQDDSGDDDSGDLKMRFDMNVLEHLGLKMYTTLPSVISEYVANAWDAWANKVDVQIPEDEKMNPDFEIIIYDNGLGMTRKEINDKFLVVGRNRRWAEADGDEMKDTIERDGEERPIIGRKGIGKLAGFGVANTINIWTCRDGEYTEFQLNYREMKERAPDEPDVKETYYPEIIDEGEADPGTDGTIITLTDLQYEQRPTTRYVRQRLARRFSVLDEDFDIVVNDEPISADERNLRARCQFVEEVDTTLTSEDGKEFPVEGWIGSFQNTVDDEIGTGVVVMARGKMVQSPTHFDIAEGGTTGQGTLSYLVGEVRAPWLDEGERDLVATSRNEVLWDEHPATLLRDHLREKLRRFCREWPERRREEEMEDVVESESYQQYIEPLDEWEKEVADDFLGQLAEGEGYDDEILEEMAQYVSSGVQQQRLRELLREINESDAADAEQILNLFKQYEVLDAMNSLRVVKSRYEAIQKFEQLIETDAKEVPDMHDFIADNPWLLDPRWDYLDDEVYYRTMLKDEYDADEYLEHPNRRVDFVCLGDTNSLKVIEIKRPEVTIGTNELDQLKDYVRFVRNHVGDDIDRSDVEGYVIGKKLADSEEAQDEYKNRLKPDGHYVRTYSELRRIAEQAQQEFVDALNRKAERTDSEMLQTQVQDAQDRIDELNVDG